MPGRFWNFWQFFFLRIFFAFVNMAPYGSKNFKTLLLQITFESFQNLFWIFFSVVHTRVLFWIFENLSLRFLTIFFLSVNTGPYGSKTSKRDSSNHFWIFPKFSWTFFSVVFTKVLFLDILKFWVSDFLRIFEFHHCTLRGNQKPQLSGKPATAERNRVKFGPPG